MKIHLIREKDNISVGSLISSSLPGLCPLCVKYAIKYIPICSNLIGARRIPKCGDLIGATSNVPLKKYKLKKEDATLQFVHLEKPKLKMFEVFLRNPPLILFILTHLCCLIDYFHLFGICHPLNIILGFPYI